MKHFREKTSQQMFTNLELIQILKLTTNDCSFVDESPPTCLTIRNCYAGLIVTQLKFDPLFGEGVD